MGIKLRDKRSEWNSLVGHRKCNVGMTVHPICSKSCQHLAYHTRRIPQQKSDECNLHLESSFGLVKMESSVVAVWRDYTSLGEVACMLHHERPFWSYVRWTAVQPIERSIRRCRWAYLNWAQRHCVAIEGTPILVCMLVDLVESECEHWTEVEHAKQWLTVGGL